MGKKSAKGRAAQTRAPAATSDLGFGKRNYALFGAALVSIVLGYMFLAAGSITLAPVLLVLGYVVFMLLAIIL